MIVFFNERIMNANLLCNKTVDSPLTQLHGIEIQNIWLNKIYLCEDFMRINLLRDTGNSLELIKLIAKNNNTMQQYQCHLEKNPGTASYLPKSV